MYAKISKLMFTLFVSVRNRVDGKRSRLKEYKNANIHKLIHLTRKTFPWKKTMIQQSLYEAGLINQ